MTAASRKLRPARRAAAEQPPVPAGHGTPALSRPKGSQGSEGLHRVPEAEPAGLEAQSAAQPRGRQRAHKMAAGGLGAHLAWQRAPKWRPGARGSPRLREPPLAVSALPGWHCACAPGGGGASPAATRRAPGSAAHARGGSGNCPEAGHSACGARSSSLRLNFPLKDVKRSSLLPHWLPLLPGLVVRLTSNQQTERPLKYHTFLKYTVNANLFSRKIAFKSFFCCCFVLFLIAVQKSAFSQ